MEAWNFIKELLGSNGGAFGVVVVVLGLAFFLTNKISRFCQKWQDKESGINKMEVNISSIDKTLIGLEAKVGLLTNSLQYQTENTLTKRKSPISLTELGKELAKKMDLVQKIANHWEETVRFIDHNVKSCNAYDIQQFCLNMALVDIDKIFTKEDVESLKLYAFKEGKPLAYYADMIGIIIRDKYFQQKDINIAEIDINDPTIPNK